MPLVKNRGNKRSSGSSVFSPTATGVVLIALCILGVYMFSSSSTMSPPSAEATSTARTTKTLTHLSRNDDFARTDPVIEDTDSRVYDGNHVGHLPGDLIKTDDNDRSSSVTTDSSIDDKGVRGKESDDEQEKQDIETQMSDESVAQNQDVEEAIINDNAHEDSSAKGNHEMNDPNDASLQEDHVDNSINRGHETSNVEQHHNQHRQSEQEPDGIISNDHIQHDETKPKTYEDTTHELDDSLPNRNQQSHLEGTGDSLITAGGTGISKESKGTWSTQAGQSENQNDRKKDLANQDTSADTLNWKLCNVTAGQDYIPCLDNEAAIARLRSKSHFQHRERHCPDQGPLCLVPLPPGYRTPVTWPQSREKIWYHNVPQTTLAEVKGHQNWVKVTGEFLTFPGGGTQFIHGASHYIDFIEEALPEIAWGKHTRVILDVGCGVASFGGFLFDRDVLAFSFAPKDEHTAQVQFALERGIPAISAVMGTKRLQFPSKVFDLVHCARCRVPWHAEGGALLLELNRVLRPGGHFVWSATPVYQKLEEDVQIWKAMSALTEAMCWKLVTIKKDKLNSVGAAIYKKPRSNECYEKRKSKAPPMCKTNDDPNAAWYVPLQSCMHQVPTEASERGSMWPVEWPDRATTAPYWLDRSQMGIYGKPAPDDFTADYEHWEKLVHKTYLNGLGFSWNNVRNVMDMRAVYGGFAAVLKDFKLWVMNVVNIDAPDTLPIIYERGLLGIYHDWCESFSTYPRTYDLLHADHLFSSLKKRCKIDPLIVEIDRVLRPGGKLIVRDESGIIEEVERFLRSLHWEIHMTFSKNQEGMLSAEKTEWRPNSYESSS
ncbi:methyltransferase [Lithospermum erythrorhizon]|uniref:Methyltransferase n=1 Tax=Lithospermum erythrorhizon TaxID=34254 RepID=A0AAV3NUY1_LITER